jgi:hypothetical protein
MICRESGREPTTTRKARSVEEGGPRRIPLLSRRNPIRAVQMARKEEGVVLARYRKTHPPQKHPRSPLRQRKTKPNLLPALQVPAPFEGGADLRRRRPRSRMTAKSRRCRGIPLLAKPQRVAAGQQRGVGAGRPRAPDNAKLALVGLIGCGTARHRAAPPAARHRLKLEFCENT